MSRRAYSMIRNGRVSARRGTVLVAVLVITALSAMVAVGLLYRVRAEQAASSASLNGDQAHAAAMSGIHTVLALLTSDPEQQGAAITQEDIAVGLYPVLNDPAYWYDNPDLLRNRLVYDDGANKWYFTVWSQNLIDKDSVRFGLSDEAGRINLNTAPAQVLLALPGMTPELVDALIDYRDADAEPRPDGAEQDYYDELDSPYSIKNGPLATIEELFMIKGFSGPIVYGEDANLNGLLEPNEDDADQLFPTDDNDGQLNTGLYGAGTVLSYGPQIDSEGKPQVNINGSSRQLRDAGISSDTVTFIEQYRADGNTFKHPSQLLNMTYTIKGNSRGGRGGRGRSRGPQRGAEIRSGVGADDLPLIMEKLAVISGGNNPTPWSGLVNVNTASVPVLAALPGIDEPLAQQIVEARTQLDPEKTTNTAWLITENLLNDEQFKEAAPHLTWRGYQYRIKCIGFGVPSGRYRILEAVIDIAPPQGGAALNGPRLIYMRDITRLGPPFVLDPEAEEL
jgi:hypothetical protein